MSFFVLASCPSYSTYMMFIFHEKFRAFLFFHFLFAYLDSI
jgi:hypothetical protein